MAFKKMGEILCEGGSSEAALFYINEALRKFQALAGQGNQSAARMVSNSLIQQGDCLRHLGRLEESVNAYQKSISLSEELNDIRTVAVGKAQIGTVWMYQGKWDKSLEAHIEAMKLFSKLEEPSSVATAWHQIGMVHEETENWVDAEESYRQSLSLEVQQHDKAGEASTLNQLGNLYDKMNRLEEALLFTRQAAEKYKEINDLIKVGICRSNLALTLIQLQRFIEARHEILQAIKYLKPFGKSAESWKAYDILCDLERAVGNEDDALKARAQAFQLYLSFRREGGENHMNEGRTCANILHLMKSMQLEEISELLGKEITEINAGDSFGLFLSKLPLILAGERDQSIWNDPNLHYMDAVELFLLIEKLDAGAKQ